MDLNRVEQVGVRLGFNADDALEYYVFAGKANGWDSSRSSKNSVTRAARPFQRPLPARLPRKASGAFIGRSKRWRK